MDRCIIGTTIQSTDQSSIIDRRYGLPDMSCPVCFNAVEPSIRESMNAGIFVLLGVTGVVLACFAAFFISLARRARAATHLVGAAPAHAEPR